MAENAKKKQLKVLIICCKKCLKEPLTDKIKNILKNHFRCRFITVENESNLRDAYYNITPDIVMLDPDCRKIIKKIKERSGYLEELARKPFLILVYPHSDETDAHLLPVPIESVLLHSHSEKQISEAIAKAAKKLGFKILTGKINNRLVKGTVPITITTELFNCKIYGSTTGINEKGLGARVNARDLSYHELKNLVGKKCRIEFNEPSLCFLPVAATVLRVEQSRDFKYAAFLALAFDSKAGRGLDGAATNILQQLINSQKDDSILKSVSEEEL